MSSHWSSEAHGGSDLRELRDLGLRGEGILDFSVNSNPFGPSRRVRRAIRAVDVSRYPDRSCTGLTELLARHSSVESERLLVGNGTAELIWLVASALLRPGDRVFVAGPTFGEYSRACVAAGAEVVEVRAQPPHFAPPVEAVCRAVTDNRPALVFLCNPNNPTGKLVKPEEIAAIAHACGTKTTLVVDEAYRSFVSGELFGPAPRGARLVLRSMTKDFALAGLRLGYALGEPELVRRIGARQPAWSVNAIAQAAGEAVFADLGYYRRTLAILRKLSGELFRGLRERGLRLVESSTQFGILDLGAPAQPLRRKLLEQGIQVRDCASFGLPEHIRVATRLRAENQRLVTALERALLESRGMISTR